MHISCGCRNRYRSGRDSFQQPLFLCVPELFFVWETVARIFYGAIDCLPSSRANSLFFSSLIIATNIHDIRF